MHLHALLDDIFTGTAVLHIETSEKGKTAPESIKVTVRIRPLDVAIEVALPDSSAVSDSLIHLRFPLAELSLENLYLSNLRLQHANGTQLHCERLDALNISIFKPNEDRVDLDTPLPKTPINDWLSAQPVPTSRLQLTPMEGLMHFQITQPPSTNFPAWQAQYDNATPAFHTNCNLHTLNLPRGIHIRATPEHLVSINGPKESAQYEGMIALAMELLQGGALTKLYDLTGDQLTLYRSSLKQPISQLPMLSHPQFEYDQALNKVVESLALLSPERYNDFRSACLYFLEAKVHRQQVELRYLTAMIFVETMDLSETLTEDNTQRLLGIDSLLAKVFNCLRHMLSHGRGDMRKSYALVIEEKLSGNAPDLKALLRIRRDGIDWNALIFLRLIERIDAYIWTLLIGNDPQGPHRSYPSFLGQMPLPEPYRPPRTAEKGSPRSTEKTDSEKKSAKEEQRIQEKRELQKALGLAKKELTHLRPKAALLESENDKLKQILESHQIRYQ